MSGRDETIRDSEDQRIYPGEILTPEQEILLRAQTTLRTSEDYETYMTPCDFSEPD